ncbi:MAG: hypothetical protein J6U20_10380 [Fibrobacter sp.]|nr:hypothetical protein [Fibrobacter sp.]
MGSIIFTACGADSSFTSNESDLSLTSNSEFADNPCDETREGREAIVGNDKDHYVCTFDDHDSVYIWAGESDTLTARGKKIERVESSSSVDDEDVSSSDDEEEDDSSSSRSSKSKSSSSYSSNSSSSTNKQDIESLLLIAGDQFSLSIRYRTMTDNRDGKTYKTVKVNGVTWMAENLNYSGNQLGVSTCFNDERRYCRLYGRLYSRDAALNSSKCAFGETCNLGYAPIQGICPDGRHIPSKSEVGTIVDFTSGVLSPLKSVDGWDSDFAAGTDRYGLSFVASGCYIASSNSFRAMGEYAYFWYYTHTTQSYLLLRGRENDAITFDFNGYEIYSSVRCIKD